MVFWGHAWAGIFAHEPTTISRALWTLADTRHEWVMVFFVLSGYLVGGNALARADNFDFKVYAVARFSRIYIVLIPALILTAALDWTAFAIDRTSPIHATSWADGLFGAAPPFDSYSFAHIAVSVLSLEPFFGSAAMGSNGPLWSLGFEWIFYFCFPPLMLLADALGRRLGGRIWTMRAVILLASAGLLAVRHMPYAALLWTIWVGGAAAHAIAERGGWPKALRWLGLMVCIAGFAILPKVGYRVADALIGFGFIGFLAYFPAGERGPAPRLDKTLASASYSLYIVHLPIVAMVLLLFLRAGWLHLGGEPVGVRSLVMLAACFVAVFSVAAVFSAAFEHSTEALRRTLLGAKSKTAS
jgi:peptidoglycan/LPS O-acetylase OafA/YrhL